MNRQVRKDGSGAYGVQKSPEVENFEMIDAQSMLADTEYVMVDRPEGASDIEVNGTTNETSRAPPSVMDQSHCEIIHSYATTHDPNEASYVKVSIAENKASGDLSLKDDEDFEMVDPELAKGEEGNAKMNGSCNASGPGQDAAENEFNGNSQAENNEEVKQEEGELAETEENDFTVYDPDDAYDCEEVKSFIIEEI